MHGFKSTDEVILASLEYLSGVRQAIEADARRSDPETHRGPEGTILSEFVLSAASVEEAEAIGHEVFRAALLKAGERREWTILVGARLPLTEAEIAKSNVIVVVTPHIHVTLMWPTREALIRRLESVEGTPRERGRLAAVSALPPTVPVHEMFKAVRPSVEFPPHVGLTGSQQTALLLALEDWSADETGYEPMPEQLFTLRDALASERPNA